MVKSSDDSLDIRIGFVGYRDIRDKPRFEIKEFSSNVDEVKKFISSLSAHGGGCDGPEDVCGGFRKCLDLKWRPKSIKQVFHINDAPAHGR